MNRKLRRDIVSDPPLRRNMKQYCQSIDPMIVPIGCSTILFLAANPSGTSSLRLDEEARAIENNMRRSKYRDCFVFKTRWALRPDDLQQALLEENPAVVHFSGHGFFRQGVVIHGANGTIQRIAIDALCNLFTILKENIQVVLLNACYTSEQADAIAEIIDVVIGMSGAVSDETASVFAAAFYRAVGAGRSVKSAFDLGVNAIRLEGLVNDDVPVIRERPGVYADSLVLASNLMTSHK